jgi:hypothetical protein
MIIITKNIRFRIIPLVVLVGVTVLLVVVVVVVVAVDASTMLVLQTNALLGLTQVTQ